MTNKNLWILASASSLWLIPVLLTLKVVDTAGNDLTVFQFLFSDWKHWGWGLGQGVDAGLVRFIAYLAIALPLCISVTFALFARSKSE